MDILEEVSLMRYCFRRNLVIFCPIVVAFHVVVVVVVAYAVHVAAVVVVAAVVNAITDVDVIHVASVHGVVVDIVHVVSSAVADV